MAVNLDKPHIWKTDIQKSVDMYNKWFVKFAPKAFRDTREKTTKEVESAFKLTENLKNIEPKILKDNPGILPTLRMSTCPPLAVDRLIGLSGVSKNLVSKLEHRKNLQTRLSEKELDSELTKIGKIIQRMVDPDIFVWLNRAKPATPIEKKRAATIVADRLCGAIANPIIRNAQEKRQLAAIKSWLDGRNYKQVSVKDGIMFGDMLPGTYSFRMNITVYHENGGKINLPIDAVIKPKKVRKTDFPLLFEAKSAGDYTNVNKRRKEEAVKMAQLRRTYGRTIKFNLFLCGYFDSGYLGYEASEGIDWVWEHRIDDLKKFGL